MILCSFYLLKFSVTILTMLYYIKWVNDVIGHNTIRVTIYIIYDITLRSQEQNHSFCIFVLCNLLVSLQSNVLDFIPALLTCYRREKRSTKKNYVNIYIVKPIINVFLFKYARKYYYVTLRVFIVFDRIPAGKIHSPVRFVRVHVPWD